MTAQANNADWRGHVGGRMTDAGRLLTRKNQAGKKCAEGEKKSEKREWNVKRRRKGGRNNQSEEVPKAAVSTEISSTCAGASSCRLKFGRAR